MKAPLRFKRVLLKVSGEALLGDQAFGIDDQVIDRIAGEIGEAVALGVKIGVVIGGGNIFRGMAIAKAGGNRVAGDQMGMLATVMNSIALPRGARPARHRGAACSRRCRCRRSARPSPSSGPQKAFEAGRVVIFAGGTGNPFFTTDSGAALRAAEMGCDALFKGTQVDGVYSADPKKDKTAMRYDRLSHAEVLGKGLAVMDAAAIALARDNRIPVIVFSILRAGRLR